MKKSGYFEKEEDILFKFVLLVFGFDGEGMME
jgi:hypothetical protein